MSGGHNGPSLCSAPGHRAAATHGSEAQSRPTFYTVSTSCCEPNFYDSGSAKRETPENVDVAVRIVGSQEPNTGNVSQLL